MSNQLEFQLDQFLTGLIQGSENKQEFLIGHCQSSVKLTSTQEHILMMLRKTSLTNAQMAERLNISPAGITKALKKLQSKNLITSKKNTNDERMIFWKLTEQALPIAQEHESHHKHTLEKYQKIMTDFDRKEQDVISKFIEKLESELL